MENKDLRFYREATLRICGNLEIHKAMSETLKLLKEYMPIDVMYLQVYEHKLHAMRSIAEAMVSHCRLTDILIPMPQMAISSVESWDPTEIPDVQIYNGGDEDPIAKALLKAHGIDNATVMGLSLVFKNENTYTPSFQLSPKDIKKMMIEGDGMASIILVSKGGEKYTRNDADLITLLREPFNIAVSNAMKHRELELNNLTLKQDNLFLKKELSKKYTGNVIGSEGGLKETMDLIRRIAPSPSTILLLGETGVGKEVIAHEIHRLSEIASGPFITVNCGAIPDGVIESELFGHEKGSFTSADYSKKGYFERAHKGTLFLDEIGELPENAQVKLLRVVQSKKITRVGGTEEINCDFRLIAATNRNLKADVKNGNFREDLWYRINIFPLEVKPLRERKEDIPLLVDFFLSKKKIETNMSAVPKLSSYGLDQLLSYEWPGNVRELENVIERSILLSGGDELSFDNLGSINQTTKLFDFSGTIDELLKTYIEMVLKKVSKKIHGPGGAAEILGVNPNTLRNRMDKLGIEYKK
ncbi:MAG: sigma-54 dependent transcriptional regulator [Spirochaetaceae bacterium]